jgi:hypothetical protein
MRHGRRLAPDSGRTVRGVSGRAANADDGVVFTGELGLDLLSCDVSSVPGFDRVVS